MSNAEESLAKAEELLTRLEATRAELERLSRGEDAEKALEILGELAALSKSVEDELRRAKRHSEADADA